MQSDEVSSFKKQHNELKRGLVRGLKGLSSVWGPALPSVIAILFSLKDVNCHRPGPAQLVPCPLAHSFGWENSPTNIGFTGGFFVAPNRTDHQTPGSVKVLQLDAGSTFSLPDLATASRFRKLEEYPSIQWFQFFCAKIGGATLALLIHFRHFRCRSVENPKYIFCLSLFLSKIYPKNS